MPHLLHIDSSARIGLSGKQARGSHTRRLTRRFVDQWIKRCPGSSTTYRDLAEAPPSPVTADWIAAAFTQPASRSPTMERVLAESEKLVAELQVADLIVIGAPMYNFGIPSPLKAWIDNVVRVGRTFGFDRRREGKPYWPMLPPGKQLVILSARGDGGYGPGCALGDANLVEASLKVPLTYIGIADCWSVAVEWDEFADHRVAASLRLAESDIDALVNRLVSRLPAIAV